VQGTDGNFYGTTARGGTIFQMTPGGSVTTLATDCCFLYAGLVQATDLNFYGVTFTGGTAPPNCGSAIGNVGVRSHRTPREHTDHALQLLPRNSLH
jgi:hypothetical protein